MKRSTDAIRCRPDRYAQVVAIGIPRPLGDVDNSPSRTATGLDIVKPGLTRTMLRKSAGIDPPSCWQL
jgi:hypothetical protein